MADQIKRCSWVNSDSLYIAYHDEEWGVPVHDDTKLFEFLILEGAQAGLSWLTILKKRENYRKAFDGFNPVKIANYSNRKIERLLINPGIVRNKRKVQASVVNAEAFLRVRKEHGSFDRYVWSFVNGRAKINHWKSVNDVPACTDESDAMSRDMKKKRIQVCGFYHLLCLYAGGRHGQ